MRKLFLIFILILFLTGCNYISKVTDLVKPAEEDADILGSEGLVLTLPELPTELYVGQGLEIPVTLENKGAHKVENAILVISAGYDDKTVKFRSYPKIEGINLEGRTQFVPIGERTTKTFTISSISLPGDKEASKTFEVIACYQYETAASPVVCINPGSQFEKGVIAGACNFVDAKISPSQGAPIAVTKVETWYLTNREEAEFRIFVNDVSDKGVILKKEAYAKRCLSSDPLQTEELGIINIEAYMGGKPLTCYSVAAEEEAKQFTIRENAPSVRCRAKIDFDEPAYTTPLSIYLSYGYNIGKAFTITLKSPIIAAKP